MSFILDALRRAERERSLGQAPRIEDVALASAHPEGQPAAAGGHRVTYVVLGIALLLIVVALVFGARRPRPPAAAPAAPAPAARAPIITVAPPAPSLQPQPEIDEGAEPAVPETAELSTLDDLAEERALPTAPAPSPSPSPSPAIAEPEPEAAPAYVPPAELPPPAAVSDSRVTLDPAPAGGITPLPDMPPAYRAEFPQLVFDVHAWDSDPAKRFVLVGGKRYREGDTLAAGPSIVEIQQEGVVFAYRGERVLLPLGQ